MAKIRRHPSLTEIHEKISPSIHGYTIDYQPHTNKFEVNFHTENSAYTINVDREYLDDEYIPDEWNTPQRWAYMIAKLATQSEPKPKQESEGPAGNPTDPPPSTWHFEAKPHEKLKSVQLWTDQHGTVLETCCYASPVPLAPPHGQLIFPKDKLPSRATFDADYDDDIKYYTEVCTKVTDPCYQELHEQVARNFKWPW